MKFRMKAESYFKEACKLENLDKFEVFDTNKDKTIYSYYK